MKSFAPVAISLFLLGHDGAEAVSADTKISAQQAENAGAKTGDRAMALCAIGSQLEAVDLSLWNRSGNTPSPEAGEILVPEEFRPAFGEHELETLEDGTAPLRLPANGTWLGLPVSQLASWYTGYGWELSIILDMPPAQAEAALQSADFPVHAGESADGQFNAEGQHFPVYVLHEAYSDAGRSSFSCKEEDRG